MFHSVSYVMCHWNNNSQNKHISDQITSVVDILPILVCQDTVHNIIISVYLSYKQVNNSVKHSVKTVTESKKFSLEMRKIHN